MLTSMGVISSYLHSMEPTSMYLDNFSMYYVVLSW